MVGALRGGRIANDAPLSADHDGVHPNEQFVRGIYDAMDRRDGRSLASILRADSRWVIPGRGPLCGTYVGPEQIFDMWRKTAEYTGGGLTLSLIDVLANDERAVALVQVRGRRGERTIDARQFALFEISGSTVTEARFVYEDQDAYEDFWS